MQCESCGAEVGEGSLACPRCGGPAPRPASRGPAPGSEAPAASPVGEVMPPAEVPLARLEEDVFALAEETVIVTESGELAVADAGSPADASALASTDVPPGADVVPEAITIDTTFTGGYKGPQGPSVAGAGIQTADDPFGLTVTEAPPDAGAAAQKRGFDFTSAWNIVAMILVFLLVCAVIFAGLYFGLFRKGGGESGSAPADAVREFFRLAVEGDTAGTASLATSTSTLPEQVQQVLLPYRTQGAVSLKAFDARTSEPGGAKATVEITVLDVEVMTDEGVVSYNLLEHTKPFPLPTVIELENQGGKWLITN